MEDDRMTATRFSRSDEWGHEFSTRGGIFKDRHMGKDQIAMGWMVRNVGESFLNIVEAIEQIFGLHGRLEHRIAELEHRIAELENFALQDSGDIAEVEKRCMSNEAKADNLRDEMEELKGKVREVMRAAPAAATGRRRHRHSGGGKTKKGGASGSKKKKNSKK